MQTNLADIVEHKLKDYAHTEILSFVSINTSGEFVTETRTYQELYDNAQALAIKLTKQGLKQHQQFAVMMNNHPEFVEAMIAAVLIGAVFVPIDPRTSGDKLAYMLAFTECKGVISATYCQNNIIAVAEQCPQLEWLISVSDGQTLNPVIPTTLLLSHYNDIYQYSGQAFQKALQYASAPMFLMFTSGTTGKPKAVIYSHQKYLEVIDRIKSAGFNDDDKLYTGLSLTHINAQNTLRTSLVLNLPAVISRKFTKSRLWDICRYYQCTRFSLLGGMIPEIFAVAPQPNDADNPVNVVTSSGMPAHLWQDFAKRFDVSIFEVYGSTEGGSLVNPPGVGPIGSIGKPSPDWEATILDQKGNPCPPYQRGEICFRRKDRAPIIVPYFKDTEASSDKVRDGWLHMGDMGHMDDKGWFFFHFRTGGGVRKNGDFINTALVESVLAKSPLIDDVFVYGVATKDTVAGEKKLVAAIVPNNKGTFSNTVFLNYCRSHLEKNDIPDIIQSLDAIPKTASEKPIEKACIEQLTKQAND